MCLSFRRNNMHKTTRGGWLPWWRTLKNTCYTYNGHLSKVQPVQRECVPEVEGAVQVGLFWTRKPITFTALLPFIFRVLFQVTHHRCYWASFPSSTQIHRPQCRTPSVDSHSQYAVTGFMLLCTVTKSPDTFR